MIHHLCSAVAPSLSKNTKSTNTVHNWAPLCTFKQNSTRSLARNEQSYFNRSILRFTMYPGRTFHLVVQSGQNGALTRQRYQKSRSEGCRAGSALSERLPCKAMEFIGTRFRAHKMGVHVMCASVVVQFCVVTASAHMFGVAWLHARLSIWRLGCRRIGDSKNQTWDARASRRKISQHGSLGFLKPSGLVPAWLAQQPRSRAGAVSSTGPGRLPHICRRQAH